MFAHFKRVQYLNNAVVFLAVPIQGENSLYSSFYFNLSLFRSYTVGDITLMVFRNPHKKTYADFDPRFFNIFQIYLGGN